ncbi:MAG: hypothetical protein ACFFEF_16910 [Candidatus Thorarchaeota archaeon]
MRDADKQSSVKESEQDSFGAFYVIGNQPNKSISGWIALEDGLDELLETVFEEMEFTLQVEVKDQDMYDVYYVDIKNNNKLTKVPDQKSYDYVKNLERILVMILHKDVLVSDVQNHPRFIDWLEETEE